MSADPYAEASDEAIGTAWRAESARLVGALTRMTRDQELADDDTRRPRIAALFDVLADDAPGPVVRVNRAVAHGRAFGADAGLAILDELRADALGGSPLLVSVRDDLLERVGMHPNASEAAGAVAEAATHTRNECGRALLRRRAEANRTHTSSSAHRGPS